MTNNGGHTTNAANTNTTNVIGLFRKVTKAGKVRYYYQDSKWRQRLMGKAKAELLLEAGMAEIMPPEYDLAKK